MSGHPHTHSHPHTTHWRLAFALTALILLVEFSAALFANSLALLSDAGHVLTDLGAIGLAWFAAGQARRPADEARTYGYHRIGILAALANAVTLILIVVGIAAGAVSRFQHPAQVAPVPMMTAAAVGIILNLYIASTLRGESGLNARAALLHVLGDVGASVGVILAAVVITLTHWSTVDPIISLLIAVLITRGAWTILREAIAILMESTPADIDMVRLVQDVQEVPGVQGVHDLHVWSLAGGMCVLSAHVQTVGDPVLSAGDVLIDRLNGLLRDRYNIVHSTIQLECTGCRTPHLYCAMEGHPAVGDHRH